MMFKLKNIRRGDSSTSIESEIAQRFLEGDIDVEHLPDGMRVVVLVATSTENGGGRVGCAFEGYDEDERLAADLQMLARAVDLGPAPDGAP